MVIGDRERRAFESAQAELLAACNVTANSRIVQTHGPAPRVHVLETGVGDPVVFVIGGAYPAAAWAPLICRLGDFRCLLIDRPTFGLTDSIHYDPASSAITGAAFLRSTLDALDVDRAAVVGNSQGGRWALELAVRNADRVTALGLLGCPAGFLGTSAPLGQRLRHVRGIARMYEQWRGAPDRPDERDGVNPVLQERLATLRTATARLPGTQEARWQLVRSVVRLRGARPAARFDGARAREVTQPTMLVWGTSDRNGSPRRGIEAVEVMPDAQLHVVDAGHNPWFQQPAAVAATLRAFLQQAVR